MEKRSTLLRSALLILAMLSEIRSWIAPDFCHTYDCPEFRLVAKNDEFEEREYVETLWMTAKVKSAQTPDLTEGFMKLDRYCKGHNNEGRMVSSKTWPALITVTQGELAGAEPEVSVSWFFTPGTWLPMPLDTSVSEESRPAGRVYVRSFSGTISQSRASTMAEELRKALTLAGKTFTSDRYTGAGYDSPWDILHVHHNEIWLNAL